MKWKSPIDQRIARMAVPALVALAIEPLYSLTDTAIVGHLGRVPLGGLAVAGAVLNVAIYGCGFLAMATAPRVARLLGAGEPRQAARAVVAGYWAAAVLGVGLAALLFLLARPLAELAGGRGATLVAATTYLQVAAWGLPFVLCTLAGTGHLRGLEDTRTPLAVVVVSNVCNVVLEVVLVYGAGLGVRGSALGTDVAQLLAAAAFLALSGRRLGALHVRLVPDRAELRTLARSALALIARTLAMLAVLSGSTAVAARLGSVDLAGHQIALQVWFLVALSLDALAIPAQVLVGTALGAGDEATLREVARRVIRVGVAAGAGLGAVTASLAFVIPALFSNDAGVGDAAGTAILIAGLSLPVTAVAFGMDGLLIGAADLAYLRRAMWLALVAFLPLAAVSLAEPQLGLGPLWGAIVCWVTARAALLSGRWRSGAWRHPQGVVVRPARVGWRPFRATSYSK